MQNSAMGRIKRKDLNVLNENVFSEIQYSTHSKNKAILDAFEDLLKSYPVPDELKYQAYQEDKTSYEKLLKKVKSIIMSCDEETCQRLLENTKDTFPLFSELSAQEQQIIIQKAHESLVYSYGIQIGLKRELWAKEILKLLKDRGLDEKLYYIVGEKRIILIKDKEYPKFIIYYSQTSNFKISFSSFNLQSRIFK